MVAESRAGVGVILEAMLCPDSLKTKRNNRFYVTYVRTIIYYQAVVFLIRVFFWSKCILIGSCLVALGVKNTLSNCSLIFLRSTGICALANLLVWFTTLAVKHSFKGFSLNIPLN